MAHRPAEGQAQVVVVASFTATHRILVGGELEAVHGHDFRVLASFAVAEGEDPDPAIYLRPLASVLAALAHTDLGAVARAERGHPSAERLAAYVHRALAARGAAVRRVTAHEAPGCAASFSCPTQAQT